MSRSFLLSRFLSPGPAATDRETLTVQQGDPVASAILEAATASIGQFVWQQSKKMPQPTPQTRMWAC
jgi:hypothetical protein